VEAWEEGREKKEREGKVATGVLAEPLQRGIRKKGM